MSTPAQRDSKTAGLAPYALRRARAHSPTQDLPPQPPTNDLCEQSDRPQRADAEADQNAYARFDEAIAAALAAKRSILDPQPSARARLPRAANLPPAGHKAVGRPPPAPVRPRVACADVVFPPARTGLEPEIVPAPIGLERRTDARMLLRFAVVIGAAAIAAYGLVLAASVLPQRLERPGAAAPEIASAAPNEATPLQMQPHLIAENRQAFANEPLTLGALVERPSGSESILLAGLQAGTRLSAGVPLGASYWQLPSKRLTDAVVYAPKNFVGVMNTAVDLLSPGGRLIDSEAMQLAWVAKKPEIRPRPAKPAPAADSENPVAATIVPMDPKEAAILMKQGEDLLELGDIAAARLAFRRLADAGNADAAYMLAMTFDPGYLATHNVIGMAGDEAAARTWYERARQLGSTKANRILAQTFSK